MTSPVLSRRSFLQGTLAASTLPLLLPRALRGETAPSNHIRLGVIGCGSRASYNILFNFIGIADARIVAACDAFPHKTDLFVQKVNTRYGSTVCVAERDFRTLLARPDIDGVIISTADHWHVPMAAYAALAGKAIYVEKPLSVAMEWSKRLRQVVTPRGLVVQYGTQQRGEQRQFRRACELVRNGHLGEVREVWTWCADLTSQQAQVQSFGTNEPVAPPPGMDYDLWLGPAPLKPFTVDRCTNLGCYHVYDYALGFIAGWGAHPLDIAQWGLGRDHTSPVRYRGTGKLPAVGSLWDTTYEFDAECQYADGVTLRLFAESIARTRVPDKTGRPLHADHGTLFFGTKGWVGVDRDALYASDKVLQSWKRSPSDLVLTEAESHAKDFVACIRNRTTPVSPLESAIRSDTISHLADIAIRTGREITWDPVSETIVGDAEASRYLDRPLREAWDPFRTTGVGA
jgi:predicted dehydrogenase